jgi:hypothetical protein
MAPDFYRKILITLNFYDPAKNLKKSSNRVNLLPRASD